MNNPLKYTDPTGNEYQYRTDFFGAFAIGMGGENWGSGGGATAMFGRGNYFAGADAYFGTHGYEVGYGGHWSYSKVVYKHQRGWWGKAKYWLNNAKYDGATWEFVPYSNNAGLLEGDLLSGPKPIIDVSMKLQPVEQDGSLDCNYACMQSLDRYFGGKRWQSDFANGNTNGIHPSKLGIAYGNAGFAINTIDKSACTIADYLLQGIPVLMRYNLDEKTYMNRKVLDTHHSLLITRVRIYADNSFKINFMDPSPDPIIEIKDWNNVVNVYSVLSIKRK